MKWLLSVLLMLCSVFISVQASTHEALFKMHSGHDPKSPSAKWMEILYSEIFRRLNVPFEIVYLPNKRGIMMTETGEMHGQLNRVFAYQESYPHQLRVNEPVSRLRIEAWVRKDSGYRFDNSWQSFQDTQLSIDYVRGVLISELNLTPLVKPDQLSTSSFSFDGLQRLKYGAIDVFVHSNFGVYQFLARDEFKSEIESGGIITSELMYPYVHVSRANLIPDMKQVIRDIKREGLLMEYCLQAYGAGGEDFCIALQPSE